MTNVVYVGASLDGYIADRDGGLEFLQCVPNPEGDDMGFGAFMAGVDALLMGRVTYETVLSFGVAWPYSKPVFVLSSSSVDVPDELQGKVFHLNGTAAAAVKELEGRGHRRLYVDGGMVVRSLMEEDMIDELIVSTVPVLLGGGTPLFGPTPARQDYELVSSEVLIDAVVQSTYRRKR